MANPNGVITDFTIPNCRFGSSFLNLKYRDRAVPDEVMMDKTTGSIAYKRSVDGDIMIFDRENLDIIDLANNILNRYLTDISVVYPTKTNCTEYNNTHLMGVQFDLQSFSGEDPTSNLFENGKVLVNDDNTPFNISHEMNGFFIKPMVRPRDVSLVDMLTTTFDRYFKTYNGSNIEYIKQAELLRREPSYSENNVQVNYTLRYYRSEVEVNKIEDIGYCKIQKLCYIPFKDKLIQKRDNIDYITLSIDKISLPKIKFAYDIRNREFSTEEIKLYEKIKDVQNIDLKYIDLYVYSTISDKHYTAPDRNNSRISLFIRANTLDQLFKDTLANRILEIRDYAYDKIGALEKLLGTDLGNPKKLIGIYDETNDIFYEDLGDGTYKIYEVLEKDENGNPTVVRDTGNIINKDDLPEYLKGRDNVTVIVTIKVEKNLTGVYKPDTKTFYEDLSDGTYKIYEVIDVGIDGLPTIIRDNDSPILSTDEFDEDTRVNITAMIIKDSNKETLIGRVDTIEKVLGIGEGSTSEKSILDRVSDLETNLETTNTDLINLITEVHNEIANDLNDMNRNLLLEINKTNNNLSSSNDRITKLETRLDLQITGSNINLTLDGKKVGNSHTIPSTVTGATAPSNKNLTWIDTSAGGVYKYWNGSNWVPVKAVWG